MFHLGKVIEIFGNDNWDYKKLGSEVKDETEATVLCGSEAPVQATVEMWDDNIITFAIDKDIVDDVDIGDIVLIDYTPTPTGKKEDGIPIPRNVITKVMKGGVGEKAWNKYREFFHKRMQVVTQAQPQMFR